MLRRQEGEVRDGWRGGGGLGRLLPKRVKKGRFAEHNKAQSGATPIDITQPPVRFDKTAVGYRSTAGTATKTNATRNEHNCWCCLAYTQASLANATVNTRAQHCPQKKVSRPTK